MHLTIIATVICGSFPTLLTKSTDRTTNVFSDTPSPEWIKYQQERNDPKYNRRTTTITTTPIAEIHQPESVNPKSETTTKIQNKFNISSRQRNDYYDNKQQDHVEESIYDEVDVDNQDDQKDYSKTDESSGSNTNGLKFPSIKGFVEFIKSLKETWVKRSLFRIDNKIQFLYNLKETLMRAIEQQFMTLWPDDDAESTAFSEEGRHIRQKRGILEESSINFPPEAALMSINFLTFAVFLIKLVMQVVNIIKSKHYQFSAFGLNTDSFSKG